MAKKRGRPRQDYPRLDKGTKELQQKRQKLLEKSKGKDHALAESLLGIFYAHKLISKPLYEAGRFFGEIGYRYEPCLGHRFRSRASILVQNQGGYAGGDFFDFWDEKKTKSWVKALNALKCAGPRSYKVVMKVVFYDQDLYTNVLPQTLLKEMRSLCQGLDCLDSYFNHRFKPLQESNLWS
ncbi:MAG: hypothetical protein K2W92_08485 [Alphaproteobacteria bacterium]|nr:hypothetical protein [Alphaproteobacteria bacterium]